MNFNSYELEQKKEKKSDKILNTRKEHWTFWLDIQLVEQRRYFTPPQETTSDYHVKTYWDIVNLSQIVTYALF